MKDLKFIIKILPTKETPAPGGTSTHTLERLTGEGMTAPNAEKDVKQPELSYVAGGSVKLVQPFGNIAGSF